MSYHLSSSTNTPVYAYLRVLRTTYLEDISKKILPVLHILASAGPYPHFTFSSQTTNIVCTIVSGKLNLFGIHFQIVFPRMVVHLLTSASGVLVERPSGSVPVGPVLVERPLGSVPVGRRRGISASFPVPVGQRGWTKQWY
jgi:hypothetical protein